MSEFESDTTEATGVAGRELLQQGSQRLGLALSAEQFDRLMAYAATLLEWRRVYNLIGARSLHALITHHLLDSLAVVDAISGPRVLDMGSGAGLPGVPLAIAAPELHVVLLDANAKRTHFLRHAAQVLDLANVEVVRERAENYNPPHRFDCIVSRALCDWAQFAALAEPLLSDSGQILAMKGHFEAHAEQTADGIQIVAVRELNVPGVSARRCLVEGVRRP